MRNGSHVLDHDDFQASGLQSADSSFTTLTGALNINLNGLQAAVVDRSLGSGLSSSLCGKGSGLTGTTEAQTAGGSPAQGIAFQVGDETDTEVTAD